MHNHEDRQSLVDTVTFLESEISKLAIENEALHREVKRFDRDRRSVETRSASTQRKLVDTEKILRSRDDQLERADRHIRELADKMRELQDEREQLESNWHQIEERYERELQAAQKRIHQIRDRADHLEETCGILRKERDHLSGKRSYQNVADDLILGREQSHGSLKSHHTANGHMPRSTSYQNLVRPSHCTCQCGQ